MNMAELIGLDFKHIRTHKRCEDDGAWLQEAGLAAKDRDRAELTGLDFKSIRTLLALWNWMGPGGIQNALIQIWKEKLT